MVEQHPEPSKDEGLDMDAIVHNAVASVNAGIPKSEFRWRTRLLIVLAALVIVANTVIGIYNSLALKSELQCEQQLNTALGIVADQNRTNTKQVIDTVLSGHRFTIAELEEVRVQFDRFYAENTKQRNALLKNTCNQGVGSHPPTNPSS